MPRSINRAEVAILALIASVTILFLYDLPNYSPATRLVPALFIGVTLLLLAARVAVVLLGRDRPTPPDESPTEGAPTLYGAWRVPVVAGAVVAFLPLILLLGLYPAVLVFVFCFARFVGRLGWTYAAALGVGTWLAAYLLFDVVLGLPALSGVVFG